ncbi:MAG: hypothetical protein MUP98_07845 [Candidatus Aminicenantes bacterium]|nr:hypothetical protein [Candidatus Aminicenantes bacterium]
MIKLAWSMYSQKTGKSTQVSRKDMRPLLAFSEEFHPRQAFIVCNESEERQSGKVKIIPWVLFLKRLWGGEII